MTSSERDRSLPTYRTSPRDSLRFGCCDGIRRDCRAGYLTIHNYILSGELVELGFVSLQGVDLATDKSEVRALLDAFPRAFCGCRVFHHVVCTTHRVAHCSGNGFRCLSEEGCSTKCKRGDGCDELDL